MNAIGTWLLNRIKEPSTWRSIAGFAGLLGYTVSPEMLDTICKLVAAAMLLIELVRKEVTVKTVGKAVVEEVQKEDRSTYGIPPGI